MVNACSVVNCHNRSDRDKKSFYSVPAVLKNQGDRTKELSETRRNLWIARLNRADFEVSKHTKICSDHFISGKPSALYDETNPDWAPSIAMGYERTFQSPDQNRYRRKQERKQLKQRHDAADALLSLSSTPIDDSVEDNNVDVKSCNFLLSGHLERDSAKKQSNNVVGMDKLVMEELNRLTVENVTLKAKIRESEMAPQSFEGNDDKVRYHTGLPSYITLMAVFNLVEPFISEGSRSTLTKFQKLMIVLMKLRLNLSLQDIAYRFDTSKATVSRIFLSVLHVMHERLKGLIYWPAREELRKTMPMEFRKFFGQKVAVIIDCFEVFTNRPSNLLARASTWSSYKHHNTVKFLIGVTPQGTVSFLSKAWGGRVSDKFLTENSGFLDKLLPGDIILADRGFDIQDSVGLKCAEAKIPAFTKGKSQLSPLEIEQTRKIAHLRIHVERVIGLVRNKYTILQDTIPVDYLQCEGDIPVIDKIATVCCALTNLCESVVPFD